MSCQFAWGLYAVCTRYLQVRSNVMSFRPAGVPFKHADCVFLYLQTRPAIPIPTLTLQLIVNCIAWPGLALLWTIPSTIKTFVEKRRTAAAVRGPDSSRQSSTCQAYVHVVENVQPKVKQDIETGGDVGGSLSDSELHQQQQQQQQGQQQQGQHQHQQQRQEGAACADNDQQAHGCWKHKQRPKKQEGHSEQQQVSTKKHQQQRNQTPLHDISSSTTTESSPPPPSRLKVFLVATAIGTTISACSLANVFASLYIPAYLLQMIVMLTPLVTALANKLLLHQPTPPMLWPTLAISLAGSGLVIAGQWVQAANSSGAKFEVKYLLAGISMSLLSMLLQASFFLAVQVTRHIVTGSQVLWGQRNTSVFGMLILALTIEGTDWSWFYALNSLDWVVLLIAGIIVSVFADIGMQFVSRAVGAAAVSSVISLRLVASLIGSVVLLGDVPRHPALWVGFVLVVGAMSAYMYWQYRAPATGKGPSAAAGAAGVDATGEAAAEDVVAAAAGEGRDSRSSDSGSRRKGQQHQQQEEGSATPAAAAAAAAGEPQQQQQQQQRTPPPGAAAGEPQQQQQQQQERTPPPGAAAGGDPGSTATAGQPQQEQQQQEGTHQQQQQTAGKSSTGAAAAERRDTM